MPKGRHQGKVFGLMTLALLLSVKTMATTPEDTAPGSGMVKSIEKDAVSTPLMQYGYGPFSGKIAYSADGTKFLTGSRDNKARLWDINTGAVIRTFTGHTDYVKCVAFSPDGTKALTGTADYTVKLWDTETGALIRTLNELAECAAFSPDGTRIVTGSSDKTAKLWDAFTGAVLHTFTGHTSGVYGVAFSPDGTQVLT